MRAAVKQGWGRLVYQLLEPVVLLLMLAAANWSFYLFIAPRSGWVSSHVTLLNTALFLYVPLLALLLERLWPDEGSRLSIDDYGLDRSRFAGSISVWLATLVVVAPLFTLGLYAASLWGPTGYHPRFQPHVPDKLLDVMWFHLLHVALPEEFFFRGYVQARLDRAWTGRVTILGARVGFGVVGAAVLFALTHPLLGTTWWNLDTFFPGLLFGWLRVRGGGLAAPILMHWASNLMLFSLTD